MNNNIVIIGAGLTGLTLAYLLKKRSIKALILEASNTIGGRIQTIEGLNNTIIEMGATWFGNQHTQLLNLLKDLDIEYFNQYTEGVSLFETTSFTPPQKFEIPSSEEPSYRIIGGTSKLINVLVNKLDKDQIQLNTKIVKIEESNKNLIVSDKNNKIYTANKVISTIPPNLLINTVRFSPKFSAEEINIFKQTHTWMGESIKFAVEYSQAFWKEKGYSGAIFSHVNIIQEQYDHSGFNNKTFALKGFLNNSSANMTKEQRKKKVITQLINLFGQEASDYLHYCEKLWHLAEYTYYPYKKYIQPHQNNGDFIFQKSFMKNKLFISGSETSTIYGGYMDGAVNAAIYISSKV